MLHHPGVKTAGRVARPVMLKRGFMATIEELLMAAEYIVAAGNPNVILCERGIRTFERATRHTLDLNAVALVRERTHLPVIADPSHAAGVRSIVPALTMASLASSSATGGATMGTVGHSIASKPAKARPMRAIQSRRRCCITM